MREPVRYLRWQLLLTVGAVAAGFAYAGPPGALTVLLLAVFEISLSFDNALVNASVMRRLTPFWKRMFLWVGVPVAAIGMRFTFPILIVALTAGLSVTTVLDLALNDAERYREYLEEGEIQINTLGGAFLMLVFLDFFLRPDRSRRPWIGVLERPLAAAGRINTASVGIVLLIVLVSSRFVPADDRLPMIVAALIAVVIYVFVNGLSELLHGLCVDPRRASVATFVYLLLLDASFSFDSVIGAFAISTNVLIICLGLTVGALYVRTLTKYFDENDTLAAFPFLGHGAHWAIGVLATILFVKNHAHVPELVTGLVGVAIIGASFRASIRETVRTESLASAIERRDPLLEPTGGSDVPADVRVRRD